MYYIDEIKNNLARGYYDKAMSIESLPEEYPAWTIKTPGKYSVAVPYDGSFTFNEKFEEVDISTARRVKIDDNSYNLIMLNLYNVSMVEQFALLCDEFIKPGENGTVRNELVTQPEKWWKRWKDFIGNVSRDIETYAILGELITIEYLLIEGRPSVNWTGGKGHSHDVEWADGSIEVKSTADRYGYNVKISSIHQLNGGGEPLTLVFCRFESSQLGRSVDDLAESLVSLGYDKTELEGILSGKGLQEGRTARNKKYQLLEFKAYPVNDDFPKITETSFKMDRLPKNVVRFEYTVDLTGLDCINLLENS